MPLIACPDCQREVSDRAPSCPNCGAPIANAREAPKPGDFIPYTDQEVATMLSQKKRTSHVLHVLLSIITAGLWVIMWVLIAISNASVNRSIDKKIAKGKKLR